MAADQPLKIPFTKAHGCGNDFLIIEGDASSFGDPVALARAICDRHTGIGADGLYFLHGRTVHLYNSDGSPATLSGNGTRCAAAYLVSKHGEERGAIVHIETGAGPRELLLTARHGNRFLIAMNLGRVGVSPGPEGSFDVAIGNPQCVNLVDSLDFDWKARGAALEWHPHYPDRANVEFVRVDSRHRITIRIWERGAGWTLSSGTGAASSAVAAVHAGSAEYPVTVVTEGGELLVESRDEEIVLTGPAEIVAEGVYHW
jgi:diaminopimelate epimerase